MKCKICGADDAKQSFSDWVRDTFTDFDKMLGGEGICDACLFWFDEASLELAQRIGKEKPQRMRNYSHFIVEGEWIPLSKADKVHMKALLLGEPFPELAAIAESGQKHIVFRARRNPVGATAGWMQFEEQALFITPAALAALLENVEALYAVFSKAEIETGRYAQYRIRAFGLERWHELESRIMPKRGGALFRLALFLAQREVKDDSGSRKDSGSIGDSLAGDPSGLQEPVSQDDLATVRGPGTQRGLYQSAGDVHQLALFQAPGDGRDAGRGAGRGGSAPE